MGSTLSGKYGEKLDDYKKVPPYVTYKMEMVICIV